MRPPVESPEVAALEEILQSRDLAIAIQGPAGAGKTTFAAEAVRAIEALSGKDVMVLAPSSSAVNELRSRVTPKAETIQQFMINPELQDAARGGVLRIDEASFLSARGRTVAFRVLRAILAPDWLCQAMFVSIIRSSAAMR